MSAANYLAIADYRRLIDSLVERQISISSFAVGVHADSQLLASLANLTGGMLAVDSDSIDAKQAGAFLAAAAKATVVWPQQVTWPKQFEAVYPSSSRRCVRIATRS